jgi:O-antigen/teichoic acid export membrane protein
VRETISYTPPAVAGRNVRQAIRIVGRGLGPLITAQAVNAAGNFVTLALVARHLGPRDYGEFAVYIAMAFIVAALSDAGLARTITLIGSRASAQRTTSEIVDAYSTGWAARIGVHIAAMALFGGTAVFALALGQPIMAYFASGSVAGVAVSFSQFAGGILQAERRFTSLALLNGLPGPLRVIFVSGLAFAGSLDLATASIAYAAAQLVALAVVVPRLRLGGISVSRVRRRQLHQIWRVAKWVALAAAIELVYQKVDVIGLRVLSTPTETGIYAGASLFIAAVNFVILAVNALTYPALSTAAARGDLGEVRQLFGASTVVLTAVGLPLVGAVVTIFPIVAGPFLGHGYDRSVSLMPLLGIYGAASVIQFNCGALYLALGRPSYVLRWSLLLAALEIAGVVLLVPRLGAIGAAAAMALGMVLLLPASWASVIRLVGPAVPIRAMALASSVTAAGLLLLHLMPAMPQVIGLAFLAGTWIVAAIIALALTARDTQALFVIRRPA